ncbi:MAG: Lycopene cyclase, partial [Anaerolineaceae bacterium]|nr:Lycopene cyclase [Anaerolineaceae bacterium]
RWAAGLGLAYEISLSSLRGKKILIVDRDAKNRNDRTWCFWSDTPTRYDHLVYRSWDRIEVVNHDFHKTFDLRPYQYRMIRGIDYYKELRESLSNIPNISIIQARVSEVGETNDKSMAMVVIDKEPHQAHWAFDSIFTPTEYASGPSRYHYLRQHFKGWEIETPDDCFDPHTVTLFDFRTPQKGCMCFFYILPFTKRRALVEYTLFSASLLKGHEYDRAISDYLEKVRGIKNYRIDNTEMGIIPMTDRPFPRRPYPHVMNIGTKGGLVKSSSGYAFLRIQKDVQAIVDSLTNFGNPFQVPSTPFRYRLFDSLMLHVMHHNGNRMAEIFTRMFKENSVIEIFRFLDEKASLTDNFRLISTLPRQPFINALLRYPFKK